MRILIVSTYFPPLNSIASLRPYSWAKAWSRNGHDVTVLTTTKESEQGTKDLKKENFQIISVSLPKWISKLKLQYHHNYYQNSHPSKRLQYLKKITYKFYHFLRFKRGLFNTCRMPDFTDFWILPALKAIKNNMPWDIVISTSGPYATHLIAACIKKRQQAPLWIADYRDAWSDSRIFPGLFPFNLFESWLEKKLIRHANLITTVSEPFAKSYAIKFPHTKIAAIENGFDPEDFTRLPNESIFPYDGKFRIVYTGSIYAGKQDPSPLFQAINILLKDVRFSHLLNHLEVLFMGQNQQHLQRLIDEYNVNPWVKLQGFIEREDALQMQRDAHALLFLAWNDPKNDGIMTGKLFEYLYSKTFILSINNTGIETSQQLIIEANAGIAYTKPKEIAVWLHNQLISPAKLQTNIDPFILKRYERQFLAEKLLNAL